MLMITCGSCALLTVSRALSCLCQMRFYYVRTSCTGLYLCDSCLFVFLFAGRCEVCGDLSIFFGFLCQLSCHIDQPKTMADRLLGSASVSPGSDKSDETQGILKSMQTMTGMLGKKVSDIENKYEELRGKAMDEDADSVCEHSMTTAAGRGEEDACSSVLARGRGADAHVYITGRQGRHR